MYLHVSRGSKARVLFKGSKKSFWDIFMFECKAQWEWHQVSRKSGGAVGKGGEGVIKLLELAMVGGGGGKGIYIYINVHGAVYRVSPTLQYRRNKLFYLMKELHMLLKDVI